MSPTNHYHVATAFEWTVFADVSVYNATLTLPHDRMYFDMATAGLGVFLQNISLN